MHMNLTKYEIDDIVYFQPYKNEDTIVSEILKNISKKSVILKVYDKELDRYEIYDYEICILETGEIKKVKKEVLVRQD